MFDEESADRMLQKWGPKIIKMVGFGDQERVVLMENLAWLVEKAGEVAKRAKTHEKQLATALVDLADIKRDIAALKEAR